MVELRAYALGVAELRGVVGATGARVERFRAVAQRVFAPPDRRPGVRDALGPLYRRVPGARVVRDDDPTPDDLTALLAGSSIPVDRTAASWRLLEALVADLAWSATVVAGDEVPGGLLVPVALPLPAPDGPGVGWCALEAAAAVPALRGWLADADAWTEAAVRVGRPLPDLLAFRT